MNEWWQWDDEKNKRFSADVNAFKRQKLGWEIEKDYNKISMAEHDGIMCKSMKQTCQNAWTRQSRPNTISDRHTGSKVIGWHPEISDFTRCKILCSYVNAGWINFQSEFRLTSYVSSYNKNFHLHLTTTDSPNAKFNRLQSLWTR